VNKLPQLVALTLTLVNIPMAMWNIGGTLPHNQPETAILPDTANYHPFYNHHPPPPLQKNSLLILILANIPTAMLNTGGIKPQKQRKNASGLETPTPPFCKDKTPSPK
jgi:hypothetical protein